MASVFILFKVIKGLQPEQPQATLIVRGGKKIPCPILEDRLREVASVFYDADENRGDGLQTLAKLSTARNLPQVKPESKKLPILSSFSAFQAADSNRCEVWSRSQKIGKAYMKEILSWI